MQNKKNFPETKMRISHSNNISSEDLEKHIRLINIDKDIVDVINKYTHNKNCSVYSKDISGKKGFLLMWVKKDLDMPIDQQIQITSFAENISIDQVKMSMEKVLNDIINEQSKPINIA